MILRTLAVFAVILVVCAVALAAMVLAFHVLRMAVQWIAADERTAWGCVAAIGIIGLAVVMEGRNRR